MLKHFQAASSNRALYEPTPAARAFSVCTHMSIVWLVLWIRDERMGKLSTAWFCVALRACVIARIFTLKFIFCEVPRASEFIAMIAQLVVSTFFWIACLRACVHHIAWQNFHDYITTGFSPGISCRICNPLLHCHSELLFVRLAQKNLAAQRLNTDCACRFLFRSALDQNLVRRTTSSRPCWPPQSRSPCSEREARFSSVSLCVSDSPAITRHSLGGYPLCDFHISTGPFLGDDRKALVCCASLCAEPSWTLCDPLIASHRRVVCHRKFHDGAQK